MKAIPTTSLRDPSVRAAAEVIDARIGKKNNREITLEDLQEAQKIVDETLAGDADQVAKWHPDELSILRSELPQLWKRMNAEPSTKPRHEAKFSALVVDTLKDPKIRQAARVIAEQIGPERFEVNITDVIETRRYFKEKREGQAEFSNPSLAKKLEAAIANDTFDPQAFQSLAVFMTTGAGGLASHGPMKIGKQEFQDVYWLPRDILDDAEAPIRSARGPTRAAHEARDGGDAGDGDEGAAPAPGRRSEGAGHTPADDDADDGDAGTPPPRHSAPRGRSDRELLQIIEAYEDKFGRCGYDRVYIRGADGQLYVALNDKGSVDDIGEGYRVRVGDDYTAKASGRVMRVVETNNSLGDATVGFWKKIGVKIGDTIRKLLFSRIDKRLEGATARVTAASKDELDKTQKEDLKKMLLTGGTVASLGAAIASAGAAFGEFPLVAGAVAGTAAVLTGVQMIDYLTMTRDKTAIYNAAGITVSSDERIVN